MSVLQYVAEQALNRMVNGEVVHFDDCAVPMRNTLKSGSARVRVLRDAL